MIADKSKFIPRICYEIFVRSFCDSNGDGIGDLQGIISKLDYLAELGIEALWLTPIHPSPSYHKYDVTDYYSIEPEYGTLDDFRMLLREAHNRNIQVYLDLIINHTSTLHPWFAEARKSRDNVFRNFYWWMTPPQIESLGISKRETSDDSQVVYPWHDNPEDQEKYYGLFFKGMPDLNYHSEELRHELEKIIRFWLVEVGVDGFRLDAARHIYPDWEKEESIGFWDYFSRLVKDVKPEAFTVAEVWAETEEVAPYFKYLNATFHFDLSFALQRIVLHEKDEAMIEKLLDSYALFEKYNPLFIDAIMLTNHDQDRIGSVVGNNKDKIKLAASILLTLPGQPYIYYGEEIGMLGTKPDPYIREPFLWSEDEENHSENTHWIDAQFSTNQTIMPLVEQKRDAASIYNHYHFLISLRKTEPALCQIFAPNLHRVCLHDDQLLAYFRPHVDKSLVIIHNLSGYPKHIDLPEDKADFRNVLFSSDLSHSDGFINATLAPYSSLILSAI
ncbi:alpha-amylase family glycosyl hydrolase [Dyadobacter arcticus]|uniref:Alpha-amylase n=1 Tax=Dyadobacter arcticus TaxID=1078754 RepID=A0ABX0UJ72_9BACT|nr:alpha-amylase family glycosyl hydrolase [Dyadobacter arcticus]NIJ53057.1 glycosidase [Dyadobacter arcticus]